MGMNPETNKFESLTTESLNKTVKHLEDEVSDEALKLLQLSSSHSGLFRPDGSPVPKHWTIFAIGELVVIKDYTFKVAHIGESHILFEPVSLELPKCGGKE